MTARAKARKASEPMESIIPNAGLSRRRRSLAATAIQKALQSRDYEALVAQLDALKGSYAALYLLNALPASVVNVEAAQMLREAIDRTVPRKR